MGRERGERRAAPRGRDARDVVDWDQRHGRHGRERVGASPSVRRAPHARLILMPLRPCVYLQITDFPAFWRAEMASYFAAVVRAPFTHHIAPHLILYSLHRRGHRRQQSATDRGLRAHLFLNVPPEERAPGTLGNTAKAALLAQNVVAFNAALAASVAEFEKANPGACVHPAMRLSYVLGSSCYSAPRLRIIPHLRVFPFAHRV